MKLVFSLVWAAALLAGCGSAAREESAAAGASVEACKTAGVTECRSGTRFRCEAGAWHSTFRPC